MSESLIDLAWLVYFIDVLATEKANPFIIIIALCGMVAYILTIVVPEHLWEERVLEKTTKTCNTLLLCSLLYSIYYTLVPSKETA